MKILIITTTLGQGHNMAAKSLHYFFQQKGISSFILDMYEYIDPHLKNVVSKGFLFSVESLAYTPVVASSLYNIVQKKNKKTSEFSLSKLTNMILASELKRFIEAYRPNAIICTQVYPAQVINILIEQGCIDALTIGIITDFTVQNYWQDAGSFDYIVTPSELLEPQLAARGISLEKILPFGIPIHPKFSKKNDKIKSRQFLGLDPEKRTILIMGGSGGHGKIDRSILSLDSLGMDFQAIVICGSNKRLYSKLEQLNTCNRFDIYGFSDDIDIIMDAADCIITKPGGLTISESLAKELPIVLVNPLPGLEYRNVDFLINHGVAVYASKNYPLEEVLFSLFYYKERIESMKMNMRVLAKPHAAEKLCEFVLSKLSC